VSASPAKPQPRPRARRASKATPVVAVQTERAAPIVVDDDPGPNYALRLTEALHAISSVQDERVGHTPEPPVNEAAFAEVLEAIASAQDGSLARRGLRSPAVVDTVPVVRQPPDSVALSAPRPPSRRGLGRPAATPPPAIARPVSAAKPALPSLAEAAFEPLAAGDEPFDGSLITSPGPRPGFMRRVLKGLDQLPPIKLPIGPAIPWRVAVPVLLLVALALGLVNRTNSSGATAVRQLPAATPTVQPLFANLPTVLPDVSAADQPALPAPTSPPAVAAAQPIGVTDPPGMGFDVLDVGLKLVAVLALAYGSLLLLKRTGFGGASSSKGVGPALGMRVVSSLVLAPNRSVHVLKVPGGKTLLVGATPNQVNLIADLGELADDPDTATDASFFDVLKGKISP
jgi:flagellar biogenesis protein FliO